jgi:phosphoribosyl 1,2-cyclic phosphate phosphodiesterase
MQPRRAILTNLHTELDYEELRGRLPPNVEPAFDRLQIELPIPADS